MPTVMRFVRMSLIVRMRVRLVHLGYYKLEMRTLINVFEIRLLFIYFFTPDSKLKL